MKQYPNKSSQINEGKIFKIIKKDFSKLAPFYYSLISNWLIRAYNNFKDVDKFIIIIYLINKDLIFFRRNGLVIDYDTFYREKTVEIEKINISDISKDLGIPKETVRRKIIELEKLGAIRKNGKKIFIDRSAFKTAQAKDTLKDVSILLNEFNKLLIKQKINISNFQINDISNSIKENFSFCWYQFYKFLIIFTNRWRKELNDLETFCIGFLVMLNAAHTKSFRVKDLNLKNYQKNVMSADDVGLNAMSISDITGIPRPTVVRKIKFLIKNDYLNINPKKLIFIDIKGKAFKRSIDLQDQNILSLSNFIYRVFNQIKIINAN